MTKTNLTNESIRPLLGLEVERSEPGGPEVDLALLREFMDNNLDAADVGIVLEMLGRYEDWRTALGELVKIKCGGGQTPPTPGTP